jgi:ABC-type uncharacterized transport system involved in gliding motility auxiliary subunit
MIKKASSAAITLLIVTAIVAVVNYIVGGLGFANLRADLTEKKLFTLSDGTRHVISNLSADKPITIRFYATRDSRLMPQFVQSYAQTVEDLLLEFEKASGGKIALEKIDPRPDTEDEDKAVADDVQGHTVNAEGDKAYFGLSIQCLQQKEVLPALNPNDEAALEYQIIRAISKVTKARRSVIGVMSPMPVAGPAMNFPGMPQRQPPPWVVVQQLRQDYDVREVPASSEAIDADIGILLVIHPADLPARAEFALDQFLLRGGKLVAFVDPQCLVTQAYNNPGQMGQAPASFTSPSSDLKNLFKAWGVAYDPGLIVADMDYRTQSQGRPQPTFLSIDREGINQEEPVSASLDLVQMFSAGAFTVEKMEGITATPLITSSENSDLIDSTTAEKSRRETLNTFQSGGKKRTLAVRLSGKFKTAFPEGLPKEPNPAENAPKLPGGTGGEEKKDAGAPEAPTASAPAAATTAPVAATPALPATPAATGAPAPAPAAAPKDEKPKSLLESQNAEGVVFLFADADMQYDMFCFESDPSGRIIPAYRNSNIPLLLNTVEMLSGGADLIGVRSRAVTKRPFIKMEQLREEVESEYRPLIEQRNQKQQEIVEKIAALGGVKQEKGMVVLNVNQEQLRELRAQEMAIKKDVRELQKEQNRKKDQMEMTITVLNLLAVPVLIIVFGIVLAMRRRTMQAAR